MLDLPSGAVEYLRNAVRVEVRTDALGAFAKAARRAGARRAARKDISLQGEGNEDKEKMVVRKKRSTWAAPGNLSETRETGGTL